MCGSGVDVASSLLLISAILMAVGEQPFHLSRCPNFRNRLSLFRREKAFLGITSFVRAGLYPNPIIDCRPDALPRSEVLLSGLNRDMAEEKLDLIQFTARIPANACTRSAKIVWRKGRNTDLRSGRPYHLPDRLFADAIPEHSTRTADTAKDLPTIDGSRTEPGKQLHVHPVGHRDRANMTALANKIDDGPMVFSL